MNRSILFGLVVFIGYGVLYSAIAVAQPSPPFKVFIQEEFFNTKLRIRHLGPFDTLNIRIGKDSYKIPIQTPFYFRPSSDSFTIAIDGITQAGTAYAGQITVRRNPDSLVIRTPEGSPFIPARQVLLRIPRYLKGHLYWFNPYSRKGQSVLEVQPLYERVLNAIGAARIELPPGDYGWFTLQRDSVLRIDSCRSGRGPVMFFSYFGPEEILSWTVRNTARDIARPPDPNLWVDTYAEPIERDTLPNPFYRDDPDPDPQPRNLLAGIDFGHDISNRPIKKIPQQEIDSALLPRVMPRIFIGDLWEIRNRGLILISFVMGGIMPANADSIRFRVAETDERVYLHLTPTYRRGPFSDASRPVFKWLRRLCRLRMPSDTFDLYIVNMADTAKFRIMLDSTTIRITCQEAKPVMFKNNFLYRDPLDMFSVYFPICQRIPPDLRAQWMEQVLADCAKIGAQLVHMPSGIYSTRGGPQIIVNDSFNTLVDTQDSSQVLFFHYMGLRKTVEDAVNVKRTNPHDGEQVDFPIYFGPRSISASSPP